MTAPIAPRIPSAIGKVEPRALLADVGRREIDGDALLRIPEAGVHQRGLDALPALAHRHVGHPDHDGIPRVAGEHVDFDIDQVRIDAVDRGASRLEERH